MSVFRRLIFFGLLPLIFGALFWLRAQPFIADTSFFNLLEEYDAQMERYERLYNRRLWQETALRRAQSVDSVCANADSSQYAALRAENCLLRAQVAYSADKADSAAFWAKKATLHFDIVLNNYKKAKLKDTELFRTEALYTEALAFAILNAQKSDDASLRKLHLQQLDGLTQRLQGLPAATLDDTLRSELSALVLLTKSLHTAYAPSPANYGNALALARQAVEQLEKHKRLAPKLRTLRLLRPLIYSHWFFCSRASGQAADEFMLPILRGITQFSFSHSSRQSQLDSLQSLYQERRLQDYDIPFDSISSTLATNELIALRLHALTGWLPTQADSIQQKYLPAAYRSAQSLTKALVRDNYLKRGSMSREKILFAYYSCFEDAILIAQQLYERSNDARYLQQIAAWMETQRSLFMLTQLHENQRRRFLGVPDSLMKQEDALLEQLNHLRQVLIETSPSLPLYQAAQEQVNSLQTQLNTLQSQLQNEYPKYYNLHHQPAPPTFAQLREQIGDSTTIIQFYEGTKNLFILSLHHDTTRLLRFDAEKYRRKLRPLIDFCTNADLQNPQQDSLMRYFARESHDFYQTYLAPALASPTRRLIVVADAMMHYFPLEVLCYDTLPANAQGYAQLPYLVRKMNVSYQYASSLWYRQRLDDAYPVNYQIFALAPDYSAMPNPQRNSEQHFKRRLLAPLQGAQTEVAALSETLRGYFAQGEEASELQFKTYAPQYGFLHLAAHSLLDTAEPSRSSIALTETLDTTEDNFLSAAEVKALSLNAELVVLSACETGIGTHQYGEGVVSIGSHFMYAGARSLITTLWALNDQTAPPIVSLFYLNLSKGYEKDEALRRAKLEYLDNTKNSIAAHPALWGAFVQVGDYRAAAVSGRITIWWYLLPLAAVAAIGWWALRALRQRRRF